MSTTTIIIVGTLLLIGLGALALWRTQIHRKDTMEEEKQALQDQFEARRDLLPYLIESYRAIPRDKESEFVSKIIAQREAARSTKSLDSLCEKEKLLSEYMNEFFLETAGEEALERSLSWLEARTELQKISDQLRDQVERYRGTSS